MTSDYKEIKEHTMKKRITALTTGALAVIVLAPTAHADPDDDAPSITQEICGAFDMGVPPGDIPGRLGQNDGRWNYWRAQQRTSQTILQGDCDN
jgi:hypothetical protein